MNDLDREQNESHNGRSTWRGQEYHYGKPISEERREDALPPLSPRLVADSGRNLLGSKGKHPAHTIYLWCTVVVGTAAVVWESTMHVLASFYTDPLPHVGYLAAYVLAIAAPVWVHRVLNNPNPPAAHTALAVGGNALSLLMAAMMSLALLPIAPFALIACVFFGFGLPGLSPYFLLGLSIYQGLRLRAKIKESGNPLPRSTVWGTGATVLATATALFLHPFLSGIFLAQALRPGITPAQERATADRLHLIGGDNATLILCYRTQLPLWEMLGVVVGGGPNASGARDSWMRWDGDMNTDDLSVKQARRLYFLMTGRSYAQVPAPWTVSNKRPRSWITDIAEEEVGGTRVGRPAAGLSLQGKQGGATVDVANATGECDVTLNFANASDTANEARAEILLPPGAVAHHASLWINGVERPAAFGPQATVRRAYQEVAVVKRRDPLLVTMPVPGKLLVQCFPIPAHGTMKIRLGMTFPLLPDASDRRKLSYALPAWGATNFADAGKLSEALPIMDVTTGKPPVLPLTLPYGIRWSERATVRKPVNLVVAFDSSIGMHEVFGTAEQNALRDALEALPAGSTVRYTATNAPVQSDTTGLLRFVAGQDNVATLTKIVRNELGPDGILLYLHAGTPDSVSDAAPLSEAVKALTDQSESRPRFVSLLLAPSASDTIGDRLAMQRNARASSVALYPGAPDAITTTIDSLVRGDDFPRLDTKQPTPATERLQAYRDALAVWYRYNNFGPEALAAARSAARLRLVTPVSGAVVLETQADYKKNGLDDGTEAAKKQNDTLVAPEPGTWLLMGLGVGGWALAKGRKHLKRRSKAA